MTVFSLPRNFVAKVWPFADSRSRLSRALSDNESAMYLCMSFVDESTLSGLIWMSFAVIMSNLATLPLSGTWQKFYSRFSQMSRSLVSAVVGASWLRPTCCRLANTETSGHIGQLSER